MGWTVSRDASGGDRVTVAVVGESTVLTPDGFVMTGSVRRRVKPDFRSSYDAFRAEVPVVEKEEEERVDGKGVSGAGEAGIRDDWVEDGVRVVESGVNDDDDEEEVDCNPAPPAMSSPVDR